MKRCLLVSLLATFCLTSTLQGWGEGFSVGGSRNGRDTSDKSQQHQFVSVNEWQVQSEPRDGAPQVKGRVQVSCYSDDKDDFMLDIDGLQPKATYSVWLVTSLKATADRAGVGPEPFAVRADAKGHLHLGTPLRTCPLGGYKWVEVREHGEGATSSTDSSTRVARVRMIGE